MAVCRELPPLEEEEGANSVRPLPPIVKAVTELRLSATAKSMIALSKQPNSLMYNLTILNQGQKRCSSISQEKWTGILLLELCLGKSMKNDREEVLKGHAREQFWRDP